MTLRLAAAALSGIVVLTGCPRNKPEDKPAPKTEAKSDAGHVDEPGHDELPRRIHLTKAVIADAKLQSIAAIKEPLAITLALPGEIVADPDKSARVSSLVAGKLTDIRFKEGSSVKRGDVLAIVRVPEIGKVRGAHDSLVAKAAAARSNADRLTELAGKGLASEQERISAKADADALDAEARALGEQLAALGMASAGAGSELALRTPVSGIVITRDAVVGQPVSTEQTIATIADLGEVWFLGRVFEKDLGRLRLGSTAEVELNAYPKERFQGIIEYLARQIDPVARTVTARIRLTNHDDMLRLGLFGTARVASQEEQREKSGPSIVVPRTAIAEIGGKPYVFVRHPDDDFELHDVVLGESALGKVEVLNGLREGEQVVVDGVFTLKSAVLKSSIAEEE